MAAMSDETMPGDGQPAPAEQQQPFFQPPADPSQAWAGNPYAPTPGQQELPSYGQPGFGSASSFPPGYGAGPGGTPPPTYQAWGYIAAVGGVLFSLILGFPAALIALRHARKVRPTWESGNQQGAITSSRKARTWAIVSTALDLLGIVLLVVVVIASAHKTSSSSNFNNPAVVAASIKAQLQKRISDPSSQYYIAGVTVTSVVCTAAGNNTDHCVDTFSNGQTATETAVISSDGQNYITR
jgi:hypothetical protein